MASKFDIARKAIRAMGYTITRRPDGEFRANIAGGNEDTAYYTSDLDDAVATVRYDVTNGKIEAAMRWHRLARAASVNLDSFADDILTDIIIPPSGWAFVDTSI